MMKRGFIYYADLSPVVGCEEGGLRPVVIVSNDLNNKYSPIVSVVPITSRLGKEWLPTHILLSSSSSEFAKDLKIRVEQIRTIDKKRLKECMGSLDKETMEKVDVAIKIHLGLDQP